MPPSARPVGLPVVGQVQEPAAGLRAALVRQLPELPGPVLAAWARGCLVRRFVSEHFDALEFEWQLRQEWCKGAAFWFGRRCEFLTMR